MSTTGKWETNMASAGKRYQLTQKRIVKSLDELASREPAISRAVALVGYPDERRREQGFDAFARIIIGQQVSTKAARAITNRLIDAVGGELIPEAIADAADPDLRAAGVSGQKVNYLRALTTAVMSGDLPIADLSQLPDNEVVARITAVKGFGEWSAHMYLMFSMGRPDIWPVGDLAVRAGFGRLMGMEARPTPKQTGLAAKPFAPHRSALALLCWKFYSEAPL